MGGDARGRRVGDAEHRDPAGRAAGRNLHLGAAPGPTLRAASLRPQARRRLAPAGAPRPRRLFRLPRSRSRRRLGLHGRADRLVPPLRRARCWRVGRHRCRVPGCEAAGIGARVSGRVPRRERSLPGSHPEPDAARLPRLRHRDERRCGTPATSGLRHLRRDLTAAAAVLPGKRTAAHVAATLPRRAVPTLHVGCARLGEAPDHSSLGRAFALGLGFLVTQFAAWQWVA
jgi:hypothetical protein